MNWFFKRKERRTDSGPVVAVPRTDADIRLENAEKILEKAHNQFIEATRTLDEFIKDFKAINRGQ